MLSFLKFNYSTNEEKKDIESTWELIDETLFIEYHPQASNMDGISLGIWRGCQDVIDRQLDLFE